MLRAVSHKQRVTVVLFVTIVSCSFTAGAQRPKPTGQSVISGRVVFADSGRAVRRATVKLFGDLTRRAVRTTAANVRGEFRFSEVPAGSFFVVAEAPGVVYPRSAFAINEFGIGSDVEIEQTRVTVDGKNSIRCEVRAVRGGTIRGTITYADKEPVLNGRIVLFRRKEGAVIPYFANVEPTNDRGMYRIDGLPEGEYFLGVVATKKLSSNPTGDDELGIPTAYYPGVVNISEAKPIQIQSGSDVAGISITLDDEPLHKISGVVRWKPSGTPVRGAVLLLRRKDDPKVELSLASFYNEMGRPEEGDVFSLSYFDLVAKGFPPIAEADANGEWKFDDLPPGTYIITAAGSAPRTDKNPTGGDAPSRSDIDEDHLVQRQVEVTIAEEDRKNVSIELSPGSRILGNVVVEGSQEMASIFITVDATGDDSLLSLPRHTNPDGTFVIEAVSPGEVILDADVIGQNDLYLKSITLGSQDLLRDPLRLTEGAEVTGVRITLGKGEATLTGRVQLKDGSPAAGGGVLLVLADPKLWRLRSSRVFMTTNAAGEFKLKCAPGQYLVFTWAAGDQPLRSIEDFVRTQGSAARTISLQVGEEKQIELAVAPRK